MISFRENKIILFLKEFNDKKDYINRLKEKIYLIKSHLFSYRFIIFKNNFITSYNCELYDI